MKRKILSFLAMVTLAVAGVTVMAPEPAMAAGGESCGSGQFLGFKPWYDGLCSGGEIEKPNGDDGIVEFVWTIVLNILFDLTLVIGYIALAMVIYGGYLYMMSQGDPVRMAKGKKTLTSAIVGVIIAMLASVIVNTITFVLGIDKAGGWEQGDVNTERLQNVFDWAYAMAGLVAVIFIIKGGVDYVLSRGMPDRVRKATQGIIFAIVGLLIVIAAAALTSFILGSISGAVAVAPAITVIGGWLG